METPSNPPLWLRTDEAEDVAGSVRHALACRDLISTDAQAWKWFALALHAALQGALVGHLVTTAAPIGAVTDRNAREWAEYFERQREDDTVGPPATRLLNLPGLVDLARSQKSCGSGDDTIRLAISDAEARWLRRFNSEVRNQLVHFGPMGWSLDVSGVPALASLVSRIVGDIAQIGWAFRHKSTSWRRALTDDLVRLGGSRSPDLAAFQQK